MCIVYVRKKNQLSSFIIHTRVASGKRERRRIQRQRRRRQELRDPQVAAKNNNINNVKK